MRFLDGYIPDLVEAQDARALGKPSARESLLEGAAPWDAADVPPVTTWSSFESRLGSLPEVATHWWTMADPDALFTASQEYRPNCAGFSEANAALMRTLIQRHAQHSEQKVERFNPMALWQASKGGSVRGGQSISAMAKYGNSVGNFLASDLGEYDPAVTFSSLTDEQKAHAGAHQIGVCMCESSDPVAALFEACKKGFTAFIGNSVAVRGSARDSHGVVVASLGGGWSHATAFGGYQKKDGAEYLFWVNSHGKIYDTEDAPRFGCWMDKDTVQRFLSSSFCDVCFVTYAEAPYDLTVAPTLNPMEAL